MRTNNSYTKVIKYTKKANARMGRNLKQGYTCIINELQLEAQEEKPGNNRVNLARNGLRECLLLSDSTAAACN